MKKRKNIRKLRPNLWQGRKVINGKRISVYGRTVEEVERKLQALHQNTYAEVLKPKRIKYKTYGAWLNEWFDVYKKPKLKETSLYQIDVCIRIHIPQWVKDKPVSDLTVLDVERALSEVRSSRMREYTYTVYSESIRKAYHMDLISKPIVDYVEPIRHERESGRALTLSEQRAYLTKITGHPFEKLFKFYLLTGCRRSEALLLKVSDVDFEHNCFHVPGTKTKLSDRTIPLFPDVKELLLSIEPVNGYYFPYKPNYVTKQQIKIAPDISLKDLRHTFGTRCFQCGIPELVYKQWLGHSPSSKVTNTVYTHVDDVQQREAQRFTLTPETDESITKPVGNGPTGNGSSGRI